MVSGRLNLVPAHLDGFRPAPSIEDRAAWGGLPPDLARAVVAAGEAHLGTDWPALSATLALAYRRSGDRVGFETPYFARRRRLNDLILAECVEGRGRFLDGIIDGLWLIAEESGWQLPAHNAYGRGGARLPLPDPDRPVIDLFAAETGAQLAAALFLLEGRLEEAAPGLPARLHRELDRRIVRPYLTEHFWWMGNGDEPMNNWTVWCTQNVLWTVFLRPGDQALRHQVLAKAAGSIDAFLKDYGEDGACEEGAQYYRHAGLCLFNALATLSSLAPDAFGPLFNEPKIRNIADYIRHVHVAGRRYINFADCAAVCDPCGARDYLFGKAVGARAPMAFAASDWRSAGEPLFSEEINLVYRLQALFCVEEMRAFQEEPSPPPDIFYPSIGLFIARDSRFTLAVKAGDNGDSHNHNDVGSVILYRDGRPLLIDVGVGTYTAKTFSPQRYEIWTMQSAFHTLPSFEGLMQQAGEAFAARDVEVDLNTGQPRIGLDLAGAYPADPRLRAYRRSVRLVKDSHVEIIDRYDGDLACELSLMVVEEPRVTEAGIVLGDLAVLRVTGAGPTRIEPIAIEDPRLRQSWPERIYRLLLPLAGPQLTLTIDGATP
ncbi:heparinase [Xaviernesmea oryzae]|uniref:Heparinase n=1 Tax=Xaviernesmea oryzae TaxID=464029 RepID=A0A1Q9AYS6_9HYPH|nr:heparinase II/III family protein [Xaviernesmea oryzae]OLP60604.1 heparinase [Xaviernesmea oryzae]SEM32878.1 Heparinase II/III-like protein [Xaviernesmea oryzae]